MIDGPMIPKALCLLALLASCTPPQQRGERNHVTMRSATPGQDYLLSAAELAALTDSANKDDLRAINRLILHYELAAPNDDMAMRWTRTAANLGDPGAMLNLSTYLEMTGRENSCREAEAWLVRVQASTSEPRLIGRAHRKLSMLRAGVNGDGPCVRWFERRHNR